MGDLWILAYNKKFDKRSFESGYRAGVQQMLDMIEMFEEEDNI
jgi:endonuclease/exonuclease/phosphatase (EEP) superfamily protein YafD